MTIVHEPTREQLLARRAAILERLGLTAEEFAARVGAGALVGAEWDALSELENIGFLLGGE